MDKFFSLTSFKITFSLILIFLLPRREKILASGSLGAPATNFFERQGLSASLTQTLNNEKQSIAHQKTRQRFINSIFFSYTFGPDYFLFHLLLIIFPDSPTN